MNCNNFAHYFLYNQILPKSKIIRAALQNNNFNKEAMPKIRKQPKRTTKRLIVPSLRNPFLKQQPILPALIAENLKHLDRIIPRHLDQVICEPEESPSNNISLMKEALSQQELKINGLKELRVGKKKNLETITGQNLGKQPHAEDEPSSNELLDFPVDGIDWILYQNQPMDFF